MADMRYRSRRDGHYARGPRKTKKQFNNYDFKGAFGLSLAPGRHWAAADCRFCYEFDAGWPRAAGRDVLGNLSHIGETALMAINS